MGAADLEENFRVPVPNQRDDFTNSKTEDYRQRMSGCLNACYEEFFLFFSIFFLRLCGLA